MQSYVLHRQGALGKQDLRRTVNFHVQLLLKSCCIPHFLFLKFVNSGFVYFLIRRALEKQQEKLRLESVLCHSVIKSFASIVISAHYILCLFTWKPKFISDVLSHVGLPLPDSELTKKPISLQFTSKCTYLVFFFPVARHNLWADAENLTLFGSYIAAWH